MDPIGVHLVGMCVRGGGCITRWGGRKRFSHAEMGGGGAHKALR